MTDQEIRQLIESGVERSEIEYVMSLDYIGEAFQRQLLQLLADGNMDAYEGALTQLYEMDILKESDYERDYELSSEQEAQLNAALDYVMSLDEPPKELPLQMQYLNNSLIVRKLFYYDGDVLENVAPGVYDSREFETQRGEQWTVDFWSDSGLTIDKSLDPFDLAVLDAIYTLHCNGIKLFSTKWLDMLLSGNGKKAPTANSMARIDRTIEKLSLIHVEYAVGSEKAEETPLLSVVTFGNSQGNFYYLNNINNLYAYAHDKKQVANTPNSYFDTSKLPKEFAFADTETAMIIKRRVILRVMRILKISSGTAKLKNWNRISLIQKKDKSEGLFPELGLMPNIDGLDAEEAEKKLKQWRTKQKPLYIKVVRGTLENLKRQFVILDYEEHRDNDSKNPKDPVTGFDVICFTRKELSNLQRQREEQKPLYVKTLLENRQKAGS